MAKENGKFPAWLGLHLWQIQPVRDAMLIASIVGLIWLGYSLRVVTVPLLLALLLAYLFEPLVRRVTRRGWLSRQGMAVLIILTAGLLVVLPVIAGVGFGAVQAVNFGQQLAGNIERLRRSVEAPADEGLRAALPGGPWVAVRDAIVFERETAARNLGPAREVDAAPNGEPGATEPGVVEPGITEPGAGEPGAAGDGAAAGAEGAAPVVQEEGLFQEGIEETRSAVRQAVSWVYHLVEANAGTIARTVGRQAIGTGADAALAAFRFFFSIGFLAFTGFLTAFFFYFFCTSWGAVLSFWEKFIPDQRRTRVVYLLGQMDRAIAGFVRGRLTICGGMMVYFTLAYWMVGTPAPLILGPAVGLLSLLPYVAGLGMPVAMLLMAFNPDVSGWQAEWWWIVGGPILVSVVSQIIDDYVLTPTIQGKRTNMDTPTIVFASLSGGVLAGVYGFLLAIPVAACIKILLIEVVWPRIRAWAEGKSADPLPLGGIDERVE
jgi:predicted PurR-regulated permease PerM